MSKTKFDFGIMFKSAILLVIMIFPLSYVHEFGHAMVCSAEGFDFEITVDEMGGQMFCYGDVSNDVLIRIMGGVLAMIVCFLPLVKWNWCKKHPYIIISCVVLGIGHGVNALIETFASEIYLSEHVILTNFMGFFVFVIFLIFMKKFGSKNRLSSGAYNG